MFEKENKLSDYIDSLNSEKKPNEHCNVEEEMEMEELFETVRRVKSLKEPILPEEDYPINLARSINERVSLPKKTSVKVKKSRYLAIASIAAVIALIVTISINNLPTSTRSMVYAMEKAFQEVKAYHGILEVIETNGRGEVTLQSKAEVWADKEGRYYVKGLEGAQKNIITANNGNKKWQVQPEEKEVNIFAAYPDTYSFSFELGKEIEYFKKSIDTKTVGEENIAGRPAIKMEVTPQGGRPYTIWIDKETKMPLQKQISIDYSLQCTVRYTDIDFVEAVPQQLLTYSVPSGYEEVNTNPEQFLSSVEEATSLSGFNPKVVENIPSSFVQDSIAVNSDEKTIKFSYSSINNEKKVLILQKKSLDEFKASSMGILGKIGNSDAEVQTPLMDNVGVISLGAYVGFTGLNSVRWQEDGIEVAVIGNTSLEDLTLFIQQLTKGKIELSPSNTQTLSKPQVEVEVDLEEEQRSQKNVDSGHSPWKLDLAYVTQVFVSKLIYPNGIEGDYPIAYDDLKIVYNDGVDAVVEVNNPNTPASKVYLKRLVRQDSTGIWTVMGYDN